MSTATEIESTPQTAATTHYCLGFLFSTDRSRVVLIEHKKFHKLNGVGGHLEAGEKYPQAMVREFLEETGALVAENEWRPFCAMGGPDYCVGCYVAFSDREVATQKEGAVNWYRLADLNQDVCMDNLSWLIPMALDKSVKQGIVLNS